MSSFSGSEPPKNCSGVVFSILKYEGSTSVQFRACFALIVGNNIRLVVAACDGKGVASRLCY